MADDPGRALDEYLVSLSQAGSVEALDGLARRWSPRLLRYAVRLLGGSGDSADVARDVVQETWLGAMRGLGRLRDPAQFPAWIYGIATRKCADVVRVNVRRRRFDGLTTDGNPGGAVVGVTSDQRIDLAAAIRALPAPQRAVIHLFYGEDLNLQEIALALEIPVGTVKSRLHHAREGLKEHLHADPLKSGNGVE